MKLDPTNTGLLVIDVQERLFPAIDRPDQVAKQMGKAIQGAKLLGLPVLATEQVPEKLGATIPMLGELLPNEPLPKSSFSAFADPAIRRAMEGRPNWILIGIETHICVLQTARDLSDAGLSPIILSDAVSARSLYDLSIGLAEARDFGARISSVETLLFELLGSADHPSFKGISLLVK